MHRRSLIAATLAVPALAHAQQQRVVRLVLGFPPGGSADFIGRAMMETMGRALGATIVIDNRPGAGSNIATEHVAHAEPDGTTLLLGGNFSHCVNPVMYRRVSFDPVADFTPIGMVCDLPTIIAVSADSGIRTLPDLLARMRARPGRWNYGTPGIGTPSHLAGAMFSRVTGLDWTHVPFRGGAPSLAALLAGDIEAIVATPPVVLPQLRAGKVTALSLTTAKASPVIPGIPGAAAAGLPGLDIAGWYGVWGPARLPAPIRDRSVAALDAALSDRLVQERFATEGLQALPSESPEAFEAFIRREMPFWAQVVKDAGATAE
ncbi:Bug family tripartite tricarboxylate transporter substrate binding protein [Paracraurococcus lichenis]|uniref:Tripartite tricarboxylate transporter substrate-binding protein n=1 Tax=Paracraurococcus lichenis TaxID=3064888 RepID=A0ABT9DSS7_9PROT|nr:tripartite tricarboxylate transporter substrate-binding protein [Paracraurococcus sp. LOR1-02]MDO9706933.1 tripartite tricarboxylate transporter substrate-binding protein [Paracraurococcus sp. LOR1-02]